MSDLFDLFDAPPEPPKAPEPEIVETEAATFSGVMVAEARGWARLFTAAIRAEIGGGK